MLAATLIAIMLGLFLLSWITWGLFLAFGLQMAKVEQEHRFQLLKTVLFVVALNMALTLGTKWLGFDDSGPETCVMLLIDFLLKVLVIMFFMNTSLWRAFLAFLPTLLAVALFECIVLLLINPFVVESFQGGNNIMAPTILGPHLKKPCDICGNDSFGDKPVARGATHPTDFICEANFHSTKVSYQGKLNAGDRFLVAKFVSPRRWDIVGFRLGDEEYVSIARVVGLRGETITIVDGNVLVDGAPLVIPESLKNLRYGNGPELVIHDKNARGEKKVEIAPDESFWGSESNPAFLKEGQYFLLADNTEAYSDSRNHVEFLGLPNAVKESEIIGVVAFVYWPFSRWKAFR